MSGRRARLLAASATLAALAPAAAIGMGGGARYEGTMVERAESKRQVALTFDEPFGTETRPILRILDRYGVESTFFGVGRELRAQPELARAAVRRGHELGNHTWNHRELAKTPRPGRSMRRTQRAAIAAAGVRPTLFRPPLGTAGEDAIRIANRQGMTVVNWSVAATEWYLGPDQIVEYVTSDLEPGDIVLFHQVPHARDALPRILAHIEDQGWEAVTVSDLLAHGG